MKNRLLALSTILVLVGCSRFTRYTYVDAALKKDFDYKMGSYWVMRDSVSGRIDSFYVASHNVTHAVDHTYWDYYDWEQITISILQNSLTPGYERDSSSYMFYMWKSGLAISYSHPAALSANGLYSLNGQKIEYTPTFYYPYLTIQSTSYSTSIGSRSDTIGEMSYSMTPSPVIPSYTLNGQTFSDVMGVNYVYHIKYDTAQAYDYNDQFFFNNAAGIVQISQNHPQDSMAHAWQLLRWHVVK